MKKLFYIILVLSTLLISCSGSKIYHYDISLIKPIENNELHYNDSLIDIKFEFKIKGFAFELKNLTDKGIYINWDNASLVWEGEAKKVFHTNVKYIDREKSQPPTTIPPSSILKDEIVPIDAVYFSNNRYLYGWQTLNFFPIRKKDEKSEKEFFNRIGTDFSIFLPIEINGEIKEYYFVFKYNNIYYGK